MNIRALLREPALLVDAFESLVVVLIALGLFDLNGDAQTNLVALFIAILAFVKAFLTHPFPVTVITDLGRALAVFTVSLGILHWSPDQVTLVVTFLGTLMTLVQRVQISPRYDSIAAPLGSGAGPTTHESGITNLGYLGVVVAVIGLVLVVLSAFTVTVHLAGLGWLLVVVGIVILIIDLLVHANDRRL